jgi:hypothetical protein
MISGNPLTSSKVVTGRGAAAVMKLLARAIISINAILGKIFFIVNLSFLSKIRCCEFT